MTQEMTAIASGHDQCHSEGAIFSKKKGDRRISPLFQAARTLRHLVAIPATFFCASLCITSTVSAQTSPPTLTPNPSRESAPTIEVDPTLGLPSPETANDVLKNVWKDAPHRKPTPPVSSNKSRRSNSDMRLQQIETENRAEAIRNRIDLLKNILARKKADAEAAKQAAQTLTIPVAPKSTQPRITPAVLSPPEVAPPAATNTIPEPTSDRNPASAPNNETLPTLETDSNAPATSGTPVLSSPVNSFELANSLFATGNYTGAIKSYEALLEKENTAHDTDWIKCLAANCYRIQGDPSKAESLYRQVAASKNKSYPSDHSIWFLDHLTRRKRLEAELRAIDGELQTMTPHLPTHP